MFLSLFCGIGRIKAREHPHTYIHTHAHARLWRHTHIHSYPQTTCKRAHTHPHTFTKMSQQSDSVGERINTDTTNPRRSQANRRNQKQQQKNPARPLSSFPWPIHFFFSFPFPPLLQLHDMIERRKVKEKWFDLDSTMILCRRLVERERVALQDRLQQFDWTRFIFSLSLSPALFSLSSSSHRGVCWPPKVIFNHHGRLGKPARVPVYWRNLRINKNWKLLAKKGVRIPPLLHLQMNLSATAWYYNSISRLLPRCIHLASMAKGMAKVQTTRNSRSCQPHLSPHFVAERCSPKVNVNYGSCTLVTSLPELLL